jgi:hypothetical protein
LLNLPGAGDETSKILAELEKEIEEIESEWDKIWIYLKYLIILKLLKNS